MKFEKLNVTLDDKIIHRFDLEKDQPVLIKRDEHTGNVLKKALMRAFRDDESSKIDKLDANIVFLDKDSNRYVLDCKEHVEIKMIVENEKCNEEVLVEGSELTCNQCGSYGANSLLFLPDTKDKNMSWSTSISTNTTIYLSVETNYLLSHYGSAVIQAKSALENQLADINERKLVDLNNESERLFLIVQNSENELNLDEIGYKNDWLKDRISFLQNRIDAIESSIFSREIISKRQKQLLKLKDSIKSLDRRKKEMEVLIENSKISSSKIASFYGGEAAYSPLVFSELKTLSNSMKGLEKQLSDREKNRKNAVKNLNDLKIELEDINKELFEMDPNIYCPEYAEQVESIMSSLGNHEKELKEIQRNMQKYKSVTSGIKLSKFSLAVGIISLMFLFVYIMVSYGLNLYIALNDSRTLIYSLLGFAAICLVGGLAGIKLLGKNKLRYEALLKDKEITTGRIAWDKQKFSALLGKSTYHTYIDNYAKYRELIELKAEFEKSHASLDKEATRLQNETNLIKMRIQRAKERTFQLLKLSKSESADKYFEMYEEFKKNAKIISEDIKRLLEAQKEQSYEQLCLEIDRTKKEIVDIENELSQDSGNNSLCVDDLKEEARLKKEELDKLEKELVLETEHENSASISIDRWGTACAIADNKILIDNAKNEAKSLSLAIESFKEILEDLKEEIGSNLVSIIKEILIFLDSNCDEKIDFFIENDRIVFSLEEKIRTYFSDVRFAIAAILALSEVTCGRGASPTVFIDFRELFEILYPDVQYSLKKEEWVEIVVLLRKLVKTRQVIAYKDEWMEEPAVLEDVKNKSFAS